MKKMLLFIFKTGLFIFFIYNLGIVNYVTNIEKHPPAPHKDNFKEQDLAWLNEKYENALKLGAKYSPELYFADISEIRLKQKRNEFDYRALASANNTISNLATIFHQNFNDFKFKSNNDEIAKYLEKIKLASKKHDEILNPGISKRREKIASEMRTANYWINLGKSFLLWILDQYLKNLLPAFLLLWLWWYQDKKTIKIKNPLSFIFCLIIYPVIIIRTWKEKLNQQAKYLLMTVDYRQRQHNLFALFSENEIQEIKRFANSNINLETYRQHLSDNGLVVKHKFFPALVMTLIFIVVSEQKIGAQNNSSITTSLDELNKIELLDKSPPNFSSSLEDCLDFKTIKSIIDERKSCILLSKKYGFIVKSQKCLKGYEKDIIHIPKLVVNNYF